MESIITAFDEENLETEFEGKWNMKCTNYLDVKLDLETGTYGPYRKPKNKKEHERWRINMPGYKTKKKRSINMV